ncbi:MAG TPA: acyltransferase [Tepidisphaeraceae bacterium]|jgi:peptidoglycan/LPS O-acetylase OafA/YrhL
MSWQHESGIGRNNFDFVRFSLAVAVILSHSYALLWGASTEPLISSTRGQLALGGLAVDWFFVISGFLITHSWLRSKSTIDYFKKRVLRIYPGFIEAVLLCAFIVAPLSSPVIRSHFTAAVRPVSTLAQMFLLRFREPGFTFLSNPAPAINGSLWSILYEFWCYIGVAFLGLIGYLKAPRAVARLFILMIGVSVVFVALQLTPGGKWLGKIVGYPPFYARLLPYYLSGMVFYLYRNKIPYSNWLGLVSLVLVIIAARIPYGVAVIFPSAGTYLLFWFAFHPYIRLENWARYGDFSYGIYVFAFPIQQILIMELGRKISPLFLFTVATPLTIAAGAISWYLVERRFLKLKKKSIVHATVVAAEPQTAPAIQ